MAITISEPPVRVTGIVLTWNSEGFVVPCVTSLIRSRAVEVEVLVVDNGSTDATVARLRASGVPATIVQTGANLGYVGGNNLGIARALAAGAEFILVINNDTEVEEDMLCHLVKALRADPTAAAAAPTMFYADPPGTIWWAGGSYRSARAYAVHERQGERLGPQDDGPPRSVDSLCGCAILFRAEALRTLGAFREDFFIYGEDAEWCYRAGKGGWRLLHVPRARMVHKVTPLSEASPSPRKILLRDRNRRRIVRMHYGLIDRVRFAVWFYPTRFVHLTRYVLTGDFARARAIVAGVVDR